MQTKSITYSIVVLLWIISTSIYAQINPTNNFIGVDVSTQPQNASFDYNACFALGKNLGMSRVGIYQNWTAIETSPSVYDLTIMDIANIYYPAYNMAVDLTIAPIHTNNLEVPSDLKTVAFDNPVMISRFKTLLDNIKTHSPNLTLSSLVIGSEHDVYLGTNAALWTQYTNFYHAVSTYARTIWPGIKVSSELTFSGITNLNSYAQSLNNYSDYIGVSYYPLNNDFTVKSVSTIPTDFASLVNLYPSKPICFYQYGYPSSVTCNSSESLQAQFITQTFESWDLYASNIKMIDFTWLHDLSMATVNYYSSYYGVTDAIFLEYLHTLGLRSWDGDGIDKPAFLELQCQAKKRGYNSLNISCYTAVETVAENGVSITQDRKSIHLQTALLLSHADVTIYNSQGEMVYQAQNLNGNFFTIDLDRWGNGIYLIVINSENGRVKSKVMIF